jgi:hypothetical protein
MFGSLRDSQVAAHFRVMPYPFGGELGRDVHRGYKYFDNGDCNNHVARPRRRSSIILFWARKLNAAERGNTFYAYDLKALAVFEAVKNWRC